MPLERFLVCVLRGSVFCLVSWPALGELAPLPPNAPSPFDQKPAPMGAAVPSAPQPATAPPAPQVNPRYAAETANYNTEQRKAWLAKCEPLREVDFKGFRECFEKEKKRSAQDIKRRFIEVEKRQGQPFRNVSPVSSALDEPTQNPAFDVEVEKN